MRRCAIRRMHAHEGPVTLGEVRLPDLPTATDLARLSLAAQHSRTLDWSGESARLARLEGEHANDLDLATSAEIATRRHDTLQAGPPPEAYLNRWVNVSADLDAMLSIRFKGGDVTRPFVDAGVSTRPV